MTICAFFACTGATAISSSTAIMINRCIASPLSYSRSACSGSGPLPPPRAALAAARQRIAFVDQLERRQRLLDVIRILIVDQPLGGEFLGDHPLLEEPILNVEHGARIHAAVRIAALPRNAIEQRLVAHDLVLDHDVLDLVAVR